MRWESTLRTLLVLAFLLTFGIFSTGCTQLTTFNVVGTQTQNGSDADVTLSLHAVIRDLQDNTSPVMSANLGDTTLEQSDDGTSCLRFEGGSLFLTGKNEHPPSFKHASNDFGEAMVAGLSLYLRIARPLLVLPDRLVTRLENTAQEPPPALRKLAQDLVDYKGVPLTGTISTSGVFTATISLTDHGRARLSQALQRWQPTTKPHGTTMPSTMPVPRFH
jgi:hypothetical protein